MKALLAWELGGGQGHIHQTSCKSKKTIIFATLIVSQCGLGGFPYEQLAVKTSPSCLLPLA